MDRFDFSREDLNKLGKDDRRALDLAVHIGRKTTFLVCGALGVVFVIVPLLALLAPELGQ